MKVAVVTGATSGVGLATSRQLIAAGWAVVGIARDVARLQAVAADFGERFSYEAADLRRAGEVDAAFSRIADRHPVVDLLVNNAAVFWLKPFTEWTDGEIDAAIDTNLKGAMFSTRAALRTMLAGSRIINVGSVAGTHGIPGQAVYCASKFGLEGFSDALAQELRPRNILVTLLAPGGIDTPLWNPATNPYPGAPGKILDADDVASLVKYVADLPPHVIMKRAVLFPSNEWH